MVKIAYIGAGSKTFTLKLVGDIFSFPALRGRTVVSLMDVDEKRLRYTYNSLIAFKERYHDELKDVEFEMTTDQRECIKDAKYVIASFMVGGSDAYRQDFEIPKKHGVSQVVGDTLGPGGVFRFLRSVPVLRGIVDDMRNVGYNSRVRASSRVKPVFLNYANPMAMNTWFCNTLWPDSTVGLCHGVQHTAQLGLQFWIGASPHEFSYLAAGINHMAWFIDVRYKDAENQAATWIDAYPIIRQHIEEEPHITGTEKVRFDMMASTGYFMTESSGHLAEYLPYYLKRDDLVEKYGAGDGVNSLRHAWDLHGFEQGSSVRDQKAEANEIESITLKNRPSEEFAAGIINAMETNVPYVFNGNVMNWNAGLITNLPNGCCVEVPCMADTWGIHPQGGIELPTICAGLCSSNVWVQKAAVEGAVKRDKELIFHAIMLDPNTASSCCPEEIRAMTSEMFDANSKWLGWFDS